MSAPSNLIDTDLAAIVEILVATERELRRRRLGEAARRVALAVAELQREDQT